jgi:hypothetical protein
MDLGVSGKMVLFGDQNWDENWKLQETPIETLLLDESCPSFSVVRQRKPDTVSSI